MSRFSSFLALRHLFQLGLCAFPHVMFLSCQSTTITFQKVKLIPYRIWLSILTSFLRRVSRPPAPSSDIIRLINNMTHSTSLMKLLRSMQPFPADFTRGILPIPCHSHNDYWRHVPLLNAISAGFTSVEADIWISGRNTRTKNTSELYIGHSVSSLEPERTLRNLYLDPLVYILEQINADTQNQKAPSQESEQPQSRGVFDTSPETTLVLLLDFKGSASETDIWRLVQEHLQPLREKQYLTHWDGMGNRRIIKPITVVATGDASFDLINDLSTNRHQDIFFDAPLDKLKLNSTIFPPIYTQANSYYASVSLSTAVGKVWFKLTSNQVRAISEQVGAAKQLGLISRYWGTPSWPVNVRNAIWERLIKNGVGLLNVDELWTASVRDWRLCWSVGWGICP